MAASKTRNYGVLLTESAAEEFADVLKLYLRKNSFGAYLTCKSIDSSGYLFQMVCIANPMASSLKVGDADVQVPHSSIKLALRIRGAQGFGFIDGI